MLNYEYPPLGGGAASVSETMAEKYAERGHQVDVVTMGHKDLPLKKERGKVTIYRVPCIRSSKTSCSFFEMLSFLPGGFLKSLKLSTHKNYDFSHTHFVIPTGLISLSLNFLQDLPYIITMHGSDVPGYNPERFGHLHRIFRPIWRRVAREAEELISPSEYLKEIVKEAFPNFEPLVISNGFEHQTFDPQCGEDKMILLTGRLFQRKKVQNFLEGLKHLETDWEIVVTGEGPYKDKLEDMASEVDQEVCFKGWVETEKLNELLERSQIYVFTSVYENCPVALQEAMASGNAVIGPKEGGAFEMVDDSGIAVDVGDPEELSSTISELTSNRSKRERLAKKARDRIEREYDWDKIISRYVEIGRSI
jgi:glycosyltransferase involved in cell wall biosynthesis